MTPPPLWRLSAWYFFYFAFIGAYMPYFGVYLQSMGHSAWEIGLLLSLMQIMRLLVPNLWSTLAERNRRAAPVVRITTLLCLLSFTAFFFSQDFQATFIAMALLAFFWSAALPLVEAMTLNQLSGQVAGYGRIRVWGSIGFVVAVQGIGILLDTQSISSLLWVSLALLALLFACTLTLQEAPTPHPPTPGSTSSVRELLKHPQLPPLLWASFLMAAAHGPLYIFYSIHLINHHYAKSTIGALWSLGVIAEILVFMLMPRLLQRYSLKSILLTTFATAILRFLMVGWGADVLAILLLAQLMHGLTFGAFHAAMVALLHQWFPGQEQARAQALYGSLSFGAGGMLGSLLSGQAWEHMDAGWIYSLASLCAAGALLIAWRWLSPQTGNPSQCPS